MRGQGSLRLQMRLLLSCLGGLLFALFATPYFASAVRIDNLLAAGILGAVLFLFAAMAAGLIWRRSIMAAPVRWALAAPVVLPATIYLALRSISGFDPSEARMAADSSLVSGFCAVFASAIFILWSRMAPIDRDRSG